jgi:hypothetical protein
MSSSRAVVIDLRLPREVENAVGAAVAERSAVLLLRWAALKRQWATAPGSSFVQAISVNSDVRVLAQPLEAAARELRATKRALSSAEDFCYASPVDALSTVLQNAADFHEGCGGSTRCFISVLCASAPTTTPALVAALHRIADLGASVEFVLLRVTDLSPASIAQLQPLYTTAQELGGSLAIDRVPNDTASFERLLRRWAAHELDKVRATLVFEPHLLVSLDLSPCALLPSALDGTHPQPGGLRRFVALKRVPIATFDMGFLAGSPWKAQAAAEDEDDDFDRCARNGQHFRALVRQLSAEDTALLCACRAPVGAGSGAPRARTEYFVLVADATAIDGSQPAPRLGADFLLFPVCAAENCVLDDTLLARADDDDGGDGADQEGAAVVAAALTSTTLEDFDPLALVSGAFEEMPEQPRVAVGGSGGSSGNSGNSGGGGGGGRSNRVAMPLAETGTYSSAAPAKASRAKQARKPKGGGGGGGGGSSSRSSSSSSRSGGTSGGGGGGNSRRRAKPLALKPSRKISTCFCFDEEMCTCNNGRRKKK